MPREKWKEPFDTHDLVVNEDSRGILVELLYFDDQEIPQGGQFYLISIRPGEKRGGHYHRKKREWFCCVHGSVSLKLASEDGEKIETFDMNSEDFKLTYVGAGTLHTLTNKTDDTAVVVSYSSEKYDKNFEDTYKR